MSTGRKTLLLLAAVFAAGCADVTSVPDQLDPWDLGTLGPSLSVVPSLPPVCGVATVTPLIADETVPVGTVEVTQGPDNLYVVYRTDTGWPILKTALFVGASASQIPTSGGGNPRVGKFPYKAKHRGGPNEVVWEIPPTSLSGPDVVVAAFAEVGEAAEGAWGEGEMISPGGSWSMYFMHSVTTCAAETVDASGGSVSTPGEEASIQIPAGALTGSVDITIDPSTVQELLDHTQGAQAASSSSGGGGAEGTGMTSVAMALEGLPTVNGTVPIEGTVWDYGPDGLEFDLPATVTLSYEDAWIPEGVDEADLKIFVTNGIFVQPQSTVDPILNTVSAEIDHFSFAYIGFVEADLSVVGATESADPILVGESVTYQATIENFGPYLFPVAAVSYQAFGDVVAGTLPIGCVEVATPLFADVQIDCTIGALTSTAQFTAPPATFVAQSDGTVTIWMDPFSSNSTDPNLPNNRHTDDVTVNATEIADLSVISATESADPILVGESVTYQATIENFGPYPFPVAGVAYQAFGDVVAGTLPIGCVEVATPLYADVQINCTIGTLTSTAQFTAPPATFVAQSDGTVTIWMDPFSSNSTDPNLPNNQHTDDVTVNATEIADLSVISATESADPILVGESVTYQATIENFGPYPFPVAGVAYQAFGDVVAGTLAPGCFEVATPLYADVQINCTIGTLTSTAQFTAPPATFVAQSDGTVTIWMDPFSSNSTDSNLANNRHTDDVTVNATEIADLSVISATESADPILVGESVTYQATIENFGPYLFPVAGVAYQAFGDVVAGTLAPGCFEVATPLYAEVQINCTIGTLTSTAQFVAPPATFVAQGAGTVTIWMDPFSSNSTDPNLPNNRLTEDVTVEDPAAVGDLRVDRLTDTPDPVSAGGQVTYEVDVIAMGTAVPVNGAVLQLLFTNGDATFDSSALTCNAIAGGVGCFLDPLLPGLVQTVQVDMTLPTAGQTVDVEARVVVPAGITDTDPSNNSMFETTTVEAAAVNQIAFGEIIEDATTTGGDTTWYSFEGVPGEFARVQVWITQDLGHSVQLVIENPAGDEIYPDGIGGRATDNSSAYYVFQMGNMADNIWRIGLKAFGAGPYRLGLGTGAGRMDETYSTEGTGVAYGPNSNAGDPFFDWDWVGDEITVLGEEEMVRFDGNGEMVGSFGVGGVVNVNSVLGPGRWGQALGIQPDGKIVVAARQLISPYPWVIARFDASGVLDPTFGTGGITEVQLGNRSDAKPLGVGFQQNGSDFDIIVGGHAGALQERVGIVRLNPDGSVDSGFGVGGTVFEARGMNPTKMAMQSDGSILMHGWDDLLRYTPDGVLDTSFGVGGIVDYAIPGNAMGIDVLPDDRLIVTGLDIGNAFVMRLTADGARDGTFAGGGYQTYDFGFTSERFQSATPDGTGGLIAVGYMRVAGGDYEWLVSRMSFDGVLDPDFAISGYLTEIRVDNALAVMMDSAGRIVVGGQAEGTLRGIELTRHIPN